MPCAALWAVVSAACAVLPALTQADPQVLQRIEVTGSRLQRVEAFMRRHDR